MFILIKNTLYKDYILIQILKYVMYYEFLIGYRNIYKLQTCIIKSSFRN